MSPLRFQIISDLHLETPLMNPSYSHFTLPIHAPNLFLLGDIGLTQHPQLFTFLTSLLSTHSGLRIFYILGNHEPYHTTLENSIRSLQDYECQIVTTYPDVPQRFHFLNRTRVDLDEQVTVLGCTLWTHIPSSSTHACASLLTDFNKDKGIWDRSVEQHNLDHAHDLAWLNTSVEQISISEPHRQVVVLTHHSPTIDRRANHPRHDKSSTNDGFRTDLSDEMCWTSGRVKMWAFGHTHFNCQFYDEGGSDASGMRKKLVVANQKGYGAEKEAEVVVVEAGDDDGEGKWRVVVGAKESKDHRRESRWRM
jgi:hypothetical protein